MTITYHAQQRMAERGIPPALAHEVMRYGQTTVLHSGRTRHVFGPIVVISDPFSILTVWREK